MERTSFISRRLSWSKFKKLNSCRIDKNCPSHHAARVKDGNVNLQTTDDAVIF